jgi:CopG family transcriptional regulator, nickel-responsive regulator
VIIVSISLSKDLLDDLNKLQKRLGFTGRSEIIRASVCTMLSEEKKKEDLIGVIHALLENEDFTLPVKLGVA